MAKILIVDDEPHNRLLLTSILRSSGYETAEAADAESAMTALRTLRPDLAIVDLQLPGTSGADLLKAMRADPEIADTEVALYTASSRDAALRGFMDIVGVRYVVEKPSEPQHVLAVVGEALRSRQES